MPSTNDHNRFCAVCKIHESACAPFLEDTFGKHWWYENVYVQYDKYSSKGPSTCTTLSMGILTVCCHIHSLLDCVLQCINEQCYLDTDWGIIKENCINIYISVYCSTIFALLMPLVNVNGVSLCYSWGRYMVVKLI